MNRYICFLLVVIPIVIIGVAQADNTQLVFEYERIISAIEDPDNSVRVRLYSDGYLTVHRPVFMRPSGDFSYQLSDTEMIQVLSRLKALNLDQFDPVGVSLMVQDERLEREYQSENIRYISDPEAIRLATYQTEPGLLRNHQFSYTGLKRDAILYPDIRQLVELDSAIQLLDRLSNDQRMQSVVAGADQ